MARSALRYQVQVNGCTKAVGNASRIAEVLSAWSGMSIRMAQIMCNVGCNSVRVLRYLASAYAKQNPDLLVHVGEVCEAQALMDAEAIRAQQDVKPVPVPLEKKSRPYTLDIDGNNPDVTAEGATLISPAVETFIDGFAVKKGDSILGAGLSENQAIQDAEIESGKRMRELIELGYSCVAHSFNEIEQSCYGITFSRKGIDYAIGEGN